jgi:4-aminobutyrate aminotransferase-like enzyme
MIGVELVEDKESKKPASQKAAQMITRSWKHGVAIVTCGASTIRIVSPLTIQRELLDVALDIVENTIAEVSERSLGTIREKQALEIVWFSYYFSYS